MPSTVRRTLVVLTFVTGIVDAVAFLALGQVFVAMQTGNVLFLGFGIAGATQSSVVAPLVGLGSFLLGSAAAALLGRVDTRRPVAVALAAEVALLAAVAVAAASIDVVPGEGSAYVLIGALSLAMGLRNTVVRRMHDPNLLTTVVNLTFTAFGPHAPMRTASGTELAERAAGVLAILTGALAGALLLKTSIALAVGVAAAVSAAAGAIMIADRPAAAITES